MKKMKKAIVFVLALTFLLIMGAAAFAAATDDVSVTVNGIKDGNVLKLYKIASAEVGDDNVIHYTMASGLPEAYDTIAEIAAVDPDDADEMAAMANAFGAAFGGTAATYSATAASNTATTDVAPGYYFAIVSGDNDTGIIYKSMLINAVPQVVGNSYDAHDDIELDVKSEEETVTKTEPDPTTSAAAAQTTDGYMLGDDITFTITTAIPNYPSNSTQATFVIKDTPTGLKDKTDTIVVTVGGETVEEGADTFTIAAAGDGFTITFEKDYILANPGKAVVVTYDSTLTGPVSTAGTTSNDASIVYNPNPFEETTVEPGSTDTQTTYGIVFEKVGDDGKALENAVFALYDSEGNAVKNAAGEAMTFTTAKQTIDGVEHTYVWFEGLKAGTYTIKETAAPAGYTLAEDFTMETSADLSTSDNPATTDKTETNYTVAANEVENVKGPDLPDTGGIGTTIFYIAGAILVIGALILLVARRRAQEK